MRYLKAFIAGLAFPATVFPIIYSVILSVEALSPLRMLPLYFIPLAWGIWNVLYFAVGKRCPIKNQNYRLWATGAILGFLLALFVVFIFRIPILFGFSGIVQYAPLIMITIIYSIIWRYVVKYLNGLLGLEDW
jgi:hypothetical protein